MSRTQKMIKRFSSSADHSSLSATGHAPPLGTSSTGGAESFTDIREENVIRMMEYEPSDEEDCSTAVNSAVQLLHASPCSGSSSKQDDIAVNGSSVTVEVTSGSFFRDCGFDAGAKTLPLLRVRRTAVMQSKMLQLTTKLKTRPSVRGSLLYSKQHDRRSSNNTTDNSGTVAVETSFLSVCTVGSSVGNSPDDFNDDFSFIYPVQMPNSDNTTTGGTTERTNIEESLKGSLGSSWDRYLRGVPVQIMSCCVPMNSNHPRALSEKSSFRVENYIVCIDLETVNIVLKCTHSGADTTITTSGGGITAKSPTSAVNSSSGGATTGSSSQSKERSSRRSRLSWRSSSDGRGPHAVHVSRLPVASLEYMVNSSSFNEFITSIKEVDSPVGSEEAPSIARPITGRDISGGGSSSKRSSARNSLSMLKRGFGSHHHHTQHAPQQLHGDSPSSTGIEHQQQRSSSSTATAGTAPPTDGAANDSRSPSAVLLAGAHHEKDGDYAPCCIYRYYPPPSHHSSAMNRASAAEDSIVTAAAVPGSSSDRGSDAGQEVIYLVFAFASVKKRDQFEKMRRLVQTYTYGKKTDGFVLQA